MNKLLLPCVAALAATSIALATPADDVNAAAKKLADASNYSWARSVQNAGGGGGGGGRGGGFGGGGPLTGKTEKGGYTVTTSEGQNGPMVIVRKGEKTVMQNQEGAWMTTEELFAQFGGGRGGGQGGAAPGGGQGGGRRGGGFGGGFGGGANPAEDIGALVGQAKDLKMADGAIMGSLTDEGVTQRLGRGGFGGRGGGGGGQPPAAPTNASGSVKFWLKDGVVSKYELQVKGTLQGGQGPIEINRTTTVEIKDVGTTKVEVPADAKKKIDA